MAQSRMLLEAHLQALRLPTFLREYDKLARRRAAEGLDFRAFLRRWCMNRNWPATNPTHKSITYQERTTMAYPARPSG